MQEVIKKVEQRVRELMAGESSGHDWYHVKQVRDMALRIAENEGGNKEVIELAALVHDVGDRKLHASEEEGEAITKKVLADCGVPVELAQSVMDIVQKVSYKGAGVADDMPTLEGKIVQDADRLYALGAIGIGRTFAYGGHKGRHMYDPTEPIVFANNKEEYYGKGTSTIHHFYEKLLLLKDRIHTPTARAIAERRHAYMEGFLKEFLAEWDAKD